MVRRSVPLLMAALGLALVASAFGEFGSPILRPGQALTFARGQFDPNETMTCFRGASRITATVPDVSKADALSATRQGYHWGVSHWSDGLGLSIRVNADASIVVKCWGTALAAPLRMGGWGKAVPSPDSVIPVCKLGQTSTAANACTKSP